MKRILGTLCTAILVTTIFAGAAGAAVVVTPNPINVTQAQSAVTVPVTYAAAPVDQPTFVTQCWKDPAGASFDPVADCSNLTSIRINPNQTDFTLQFSVFRGAEPSSDQLFGCIAAGDAPIAGITTVTTCWIRVSYNTLQNISTDEFTPFTFNVTTAAVPEVPVAILLPLLGALVIGGGLFFQRRRIQSTRMA